MQVTKTVKEWAELLPDDIKTKFLTNCTIGLDYKCKSLHNAINKAFIWHITAEGQEYWKLIHDKALNNEYPCNS